MTPNPPQWDLQLPPEILTECLSDVVGNCVLMNPIKLALEALVAESELARQYTLLMLAFRFPKIRELVRLHSSNSKKLGRFLDAALHSVASKHLNFELNPKEFVETCFEEFIVS